MTITDTELEAMAATPMPLPFAVYGTLRPDCGNDVLWRGDAYEAATGTIVGYRLVGHGFPYAIPAHMSQSRVSLIQPYPERYSDVLASLDALEGVPHHYERTTAGVIVDDGTIRLAWLYVPVNIGRKWQMTDVPTDDEGRHDWLLCGSWDRRR